MIKVYQNGVNVQFKYVGFWIIKRKNYILFLIGKKNDNGWLYSEVFRLSLSIKRKELK